MEEARATGAASRQHLEGWSPTTGLPMYPPAHLALLLGFSAPAACFRARFLGGVRGGDETKSGSSRRGLGFLLSSIIPLPLGGCCGGGRRREKALPM
jgi:hypothetical protein